MSASHMMLWLSDGALAPSAAIGCWAACSTIRVFTTDPRVQSVVQITRE